MKKVIRLTESELRRIVRESTQKIIKEVYDNPYLDNNLKKGYEMWKNDEFSSLEEELAFINDYFDHDGPADWVKQNDAKWDAAIQAAKEKWANRTISEAVKKTLKRILR